MLAPGPTSTTKASSPSAATTIRRRRPAPRRAATKNSNPVTRAQFAPDTAVRWLSELAFIASSRSDGRPDSSPIASPGSRRPPSPGVPAAARANVERTDCVHASQTGAAETGRGGSLAARRNVVDSPGSFARRTPVTATTAPKEGTTAAPGPPASSAPSSALPSALPPALLSSPGRVPTNTVTGTDSAGCPPSAPAPPPVSPPTPTIVPFQLHRSEPSNPSATRRPGPSARTATATSRCASAASWSTAAVRPGARITATAQPRATAASITATSPEIPAPRRRPVPGMWRIRPPRRTLSGRDKR